MLTRTGDDIYVTVPVAISEAALGAKIDVPTIDGRAQLKIPPGTQSGQKLRLREKGVPSASREGCQRSSKTRPLALFEKWATQPRSDG